MVRTAFLVNLHAHFVLLDTNVPVQMEPLQILSASRVLFLLGVKVFALSARRDMHVLQRQRICCHHALQDRILLVLKLLARYVQQASPAQAPPKKSLYPAESGLMLQRARLIAPFALQATPAIYSALP